MKIKWKPVLIAGIWSEALLLVLRIPITQYWGADAPMYIGVILYFVPMFLGGLWVARKIESRYILHGVWVGIIANIVFPPMILLLSLIVPEQTSDQNAEISILLIVIVYTVAILVKIIGSAFGSYIGGKMSKTVNNQSLT